MPQGDLHSYAVEAFANLEKLATGMAQEGADPAAINVVSKMADTTRKVVKLLGKGQEQTGDTEPPAAPAPAAPQPSQRPTLDSATSELQAAMQASAARR